MQLRLPFNFVEFVPDLINLRRKPFIYLRKILGGDESSPGGVRMYVEDRTLGSNDEACQRNGRKMRGKKERGP